MYVKDKMKVRLASQVLSRSVAVALKVCCKDLKIPEFKDALPTADFISCFDILFDIMNSKYSFGKGSKAPLSMENQEEWKSALSK